MVRYSYDVMQRVANATLDPTQTRSVDLIQTPTTHHPSKHVWLYPIHNSKTKHIQKGRFDTLHVEQWLCEKVVAQQPSLSPPRLTLGVRPSKREHGVESLFDLFTQNIQYNVIFDNFLKRTFTHGKEDQNIQCRFTTIMMSSRCKVRVEDNNPATG